MPKTIAGTSTKAALAALVLVGGSSLSAETTPLASFQRAHGLVEQALAAHGGPSIIKNAGGVEVRLEGTYDLTTRLQGRSPFREEPTPIAERIVYDANSGQVSYDVDMFNYYSSNQKLREIHDDQRRMIYMDKLNAGGGWVPVEMVSDNRERLTRVLPRILLQDALDQAPSLRYVGRDRLDGQSVEVVNFTTTHGDVLTLAIDGKSRLLQTVSSVVDMPLLGQVEMAWHWTGYGTRADGGVSPDRLQVRLGGRLLKNVKMSTNFGSFPDAFEAPEGVDVGDPPEDLLRLADFVPYGMRPPEVETLAPQVYMVNNLRPGFGLLFVEFDQFVVAVDAPTGWYEMNQIPPMNWSHGDSVSALGEKYLAAIRETVPGKPVRHVVLTHHHSDHIGGLLPFVDAGSSVIAGASAAHMAKLAVSSRAQRPSQEDERSEGPQMNIQIVDGKYVVSDGEMELQLIELPDGNPKADNYLMVYLPKQKLLYATSFIYPVPEPVFPLVESIPLSIYYVEWLDSAGLDVEKMYNVHAMRKVEPWQLDEIRRLAAIEN